MKQEKALRTAAAMVTAWEGKVVEDPREGLQRMVRVSAMAEAAYAQLIRDELGPDGILVEAPVRVVSGVTAIHLDAHPYLKLWNEERDRYAKVCKLALDAGVEERQVQIAEQQARQFLEVITAGIAGAGLAAEDAKRVQSSIAAAASRLAIAGV